MRIPLQPPFPWERLLRYLSVRSTPGLESVTADRYIRQGVAEVTFDGVRNELECPGEYAARVIRLFDASHDPSSVDAFLREAKLPAFPGVRVPGCWEPFELCLRVIIGQREGRAHFDGTPGGTLSNSERGGRGGGRSQRDWNAGPPRANDPNPGRAGGRGRHSIRRPLAGDRRTTSAGAGLRPVDLGVPWNPLGPGPGRLSGAGLRVDPRRWGIKSSPLAADRRAMASLPRICGYVPLDGRVKAAFSRPAR